MGLESRESQLELFDLSNQPAARLSRETLGRMLIQLRHDQLVLGGIATLLGVTVVFACGVERGKQLVRAERMLVARQPPPVGASAPTGSDRSVTPAPAPKAAGDTPPEPEQKRAPAVPPSSSPAKVKERITVASTRPPSVKSAGEGSSRYAVQVVTYSRPTLAKREMERLRARGERAFLVMRDGRTIVYVGPFPSKVNAHEKLTSLRPQYHDCFIKPL